MGPAGEWITWRSMVHEIYVGPARRGSLGLGVTAGEEATGTRHTRISLCFRLSCGGGGYFPAVFSGPTVTHLLCNVGPRPLTSFNPIIIIFSNKKKKKGSVGPTSSLNGLEKMGFYFFFQDKRKRIPESTNTIC